MTFDEMTQKKTESCSHQFTWLEWARFMATCPEPDEVRDDNGMHIVWSLEQGQLNMHAMVAVWVYDPQ